ncbi:MAG: DUF448 domain-containing protein [Myxococcota bacterium]
MARRTCIVSGEPLGPHQGIRLVLGPDGALVVDTKGTLPGRGAWIRPHQDVLRLLPQRIRRVEKKLGMRALDPARLVEQLRASVLAGCMHGISLGAAAGRVIGGQERVAALAHDGALSWMVLSRSLAARTLEKMRSVHSDEKTVIVDISLDELGRRMGRMPTGVVGVLGGSATKPLRRQLRRLVDLG